jgi:short chain dehydrogenase
MPRQRRWPPVLRARLVDLRYLGSRRQASWSFFEPCDQHSNMALRSGAMPDSGVAGCGSTPFLHRTNNAGRGMKYVSDSFMTEPTRFWEVSPETWRLIMDTNANGPFLMARTVVPVMIRTGWGRIINISVSRETMRRRGFSPYGPSKAALESATIIWSQELEGTGVTVNALLPGGATRTGMIPNAVSDEVRSKFLDPDIIVPPLVWLISQDADEVTGKRFVATKWRSDLRGRQAAEAATETAGW